MSQFDFGNLESPLSGDQFINDNLEPWRDALHSCHAGPSTPSYALPGTLWIKNDVNPWVVYVFDGSDNIKVGTVNTTTNVFTPEGAVLSIVAGADIVVDSTDPKNPIVRFNGATFVLEDDSVTNGKLADMAANTVKVNAAASAANPTDLALANSTLLGRGSSGNNVSAIAVGAGLTMDGATLKLAASSTGRQKFTSSGSFVAPAGVTTGYLSGSGGGGGGGGLASPYGGGGGAAACTIAQAVTLIPGATYTVTIGAAGIGCTNGADENGSAGGTTSFGALLTLAGGGFGAGSSGGAAGGATGSAGSSGTTTIPGCGGSGIFGAGGGPKQAAGGYGAGGGGWTSATHEPGNNGTPGFLLVEW